MYDAIGNVAQRLDATGQVKSADQYDAWGNSVAGGDASDPYGYKGKFGYYADHETGLVLCTYRYYDPVAGRWLTRDPIGVAGGVNLYGYCVNSSVNLIDTLGLFNSNYWIVDPRRYWTNEQVENVVSVVDTTVSTGLGDKYVPGPAGTLVEVGRNAPAIGKGVLDIAGHVSSIQDGYDAIDDAQAGESSPDNIHEIGADGGDRGPSLARRVNEKSGKCPRTPPVPKRYNWWDWNGWGKR